MGGMSTRNEIKARLGVLAEPKATASRPGAKAKMAVPTPHRVTIADKNGMEHTYMVSDRVLRSIEGTKKQAEARGTAPAYDDVIRLGIKVGEVIRAMKLARPGAKAAMDKNADYVEYANLRESLSKLESRLRRAQGDERTRLQRELEAGTKRFRELGDRLRSSRPGAKAKMGQDWSGKRVTTPAGRIFLVVRSGNGYDLYALDTGRKAKSMTQEQMDEAGRLGKFRDVFFRPGAKAKMDLTDTQRKAGYKWRVAYTRQLGKDQYLGGPPVTMQDDLLFATESAARQWAEAMLKKGWFKGHGGGPEKILKATVLMAARPGAKATHAAPAQKPGRKVMSESDPAVSAKIRKLMAEGKPQEQAVAIALDMKRRGEI